MSTPQRWYADGSDIPDDLSHVAAMFSAQAPAPARLLRVLRVDVAGLATVYEAVRNTMANGEERLLWHGTSLRCARSIILGGFNRAYAGRHGTRLGQGSYFSSNVAYSLRFCDRSCERQVVLLASVLVGQWTKGSPELREPPYCDAAQLVRYDSTVDDVASPTMFCIFRDFQALPRYVVELGIPAA